MAKRKSAPQPSSPPARLEESSSTPRLPHSSSASQSPDALPPFLRTQLLKGSVKSFAEKHPTFRAADSVDVPALQRFLDEVAEHAREKGLDARAVGECVRDVRGGLPEEVKRGLRRERRMGKKVERSAKMSSTPVPVPSFAARRGSKEEVEQRVGGRAGEGKNKGKKKRKEMNADVPIKMEDGATPDPPVLQKKRKRTLSDNGHGHAEETPATTFDFRAEKTPKETVHGTIAKEVEDTGKAVLFNIAKVREQLEATSRAILGNASARSTSSSYAGPTTNGPPITATNKRAKKMKEDRKRKSKAQQRSKTPEQDSPPPKKKMKQQHERTNGDEVMPTVFDERDTEATKFLTKKDKKRLEKQKQVAEERLVEADRAALAAAQDGKKLFLSTDHATATTEASQKEMKLQERGKKKLKAKGRTKTDQQNEISSRPSASHSEQKSSSSINGNAETKSKGAKETLEVEEGPRDLSTMHGTKQKRDGKKKPSLNGIGSHTPVPVRTMSPLKRKRSPSPSPSEALGVPNDRAHSEAQMTAPNTMTSQAAPAQAPSLETKEQDTMASRPTGLSKKGRKILEQKKQRHSKRETAKARELMEKQKQPTFEFAPELRAGFGPALSFKVEESDRPSGVQKSNKKNQKLAKKAEKRLLGKQAAGSHASPLAESHVTSAFNVSNVPQDEGDFDKPSKKRRKLTKKAEKRLLGNGLDGLHAFSPAVSSRLGRGNTFSLLQDRGLDSPIVSQKSPANDEEMMEDTHSDVQEEVDLQIQHDIELRSASKAPLEDTNCAVNGVANKKQTPQSAFAAQAAVYRGRSPSPSERSSSSSEAPESPEDQAQTKTTTRPSPSPENSDAESLDPAQVPLPESRRSSEAPSESPSAAVSEDEELLDNGHATKLLPNQLGSEPDVTSSTSHEEDGSNSSTDADEEDERPTFIVSFSNQVATPAVSKVGVTEAVDGEEDRSSMSNNIDGKSDTSDADYGENLFSLAQRLHISERSCVKRITDRWDYGKSDSQLNGALEENEDSTPLAISEEEKEEESSSDDSQEDFEEEVDEEVEKAAVRDDEATVDTESEFSSKLSKFSLPEAMAEAVQTDAIYFNTRAANVEDEDWRQSAHCSPESEASPFEDEPKDPILPQPDSPVNGLDTLEMQPSMPTRSSPASRASSYEKEPKGFILTQDPPLITPRRRTGLRSDHFPSTPQSQKPPRPPWGTMSSIPFPDITARNFGLIQEELADDPFRLIVAVTFLNKTKGVVAIPTFWKFMDSYPTAADLAHANMDDIIRMLRKLGLQNNRAATIVSFAKAWLEQPPKAGVRTRTLNYPHQGAGRDIRPHEQLDDADARIGAWEVAHLPGCKGQYALDSWRIFCRDALRGVALGWNGEGVDDAGFEPEWKRVLPADKELRGFLRWMWLREGWEWDPNTGERRPALGWKMKEASAMHWDQERGVGVTVESEEGLKGEGGAGGEGEAEVEDDGKGTDEIEDKGEGEQDLDAQATSGTNIDVDEAQKGNDLNDNNNDDDVALVSARRANARVESNGVIDAHEDAFVPTSTPRSSPSSPASSSSDSDSDSDSSNHTPRNRLSSYIEETPEAVCFPDGISAPARTANVESAGGEREPWHDDIDSGSEGDGEGGDEGYGDGNGLLRVLMGDDGERGAREVSVEL